MQGPPTQLTAYLPSVSLRATEQTTPTRRVLLASCLWLDMSGFTPLTERLSSEGPEGIERLSETLNRLYAAVADAARATGGDVMFFAGDGALCLWEAADEPSVGAAAWLAASAARRLLDGLSRSSQDGGFRFELRQVVVAGELTLDTVGGDEGAWQDVVTGAPLRALQRLGKVCRPGQVLLSERVALALGARARASKLEADAYQLAELQADARAEAGARDSRPTPVPSSAAVASKVPGFLSQQLSQSTPPPSELRRVSVAFVNWKTRENVGMDELQALTTCLQQAARRFQGWLCQLVQDDKGMTAVVAFGLPGHAQGEDAVRAVRFTTDVAAQLAGPPFSVRFGVATGSTFCGVCGGEERLQYCVLGSAVNRAARLAEQAIDGPLVDEPTFLAAHWRVDFMHQASLHLKGVSSVVEAYRPGAAREASFTPSSLVAFESESAELRAFLAEFRARGENQPLIVRGDLGAGKTSFLGQVPAECAEVGAELLVGSCDQFEQYTGYFALRPIMRRLLGDAAREEDVQWLRAALQTRGQEEQMSLLNPLLLSDFPPTELVKQMAPETRAENRKQLAVSLLAERLAGRSVVVVIDDAHWLDGSSLELVLALRSQPGLTFILAERTGENATPERFGDARVLAVKPLDVPAVGQLAARLAGASQVSPGLCQQIWDTTRGNPLHCTELVRALVASGRVEVVAQALNLKAGTEGRLEVPGSLEELIQGRFDHLSSPARDVLRTASVLGVAFDLPLLREVLGVKLGAAEIDAALGEALERGIVRMRGTHQFEHASVHAVVYGLLLPSEQRQLHERTALALQTIHGASLDAVAARLAHHWLRAGNAERAAHYSALAADQALQGYANPDAEHLFRQAIEQDTSFRGRLPVSLERARWSMLMAQALYSQSRHAEARRAYDAALSWTGMRVPGGAWALPITILSLLLLALLSRLGRKPPPLLAGDARARRILSLRIINAALALDAWEGLLFEAANKAMVAFRSSERVRDTPEAAETVAGLGYLLSSTPARALAEGQILRGLANADESGDLQARTSTRVLLGMHYTASGLTSRAGEPLRVAQSLAERLGSGLWRHRAWFGLGEALLSSGQLEEAREAFAKAAEIAALAEPPVEGFANCMRALTISRLGRLTEALELALGPRGLTLVAGNCLVLQRFTSLGIAAELLLAAGRGDEASSFAREALELSRTRPDVNVFFAALYGHAGSALICLSQLNAGNSHFDRHSRAALSRLSAFAGMYPAAAPSRELLRGASVKQRGRVDQARKHFRAAARLAETTQQPFERRVALEWLATLEGAKTSEELEAARAHTRKLGIVVESSAWWTMIRGQR